MRHDETGQRPTCCPAHPALLTRREALALAAAGTALAASGWQPGASAAPAAAATAAAGPALAGAQAAFLALSQRLTGHDDLDAETAARIHQAMAGRSADFPGQSEHLARLAQDAASPEAVLEGAAAAGLRETALAIVAAWYTGTVGSDSSGTVVAYRNALMYRPVSDAMSAPTYCPAGPAWWTREPPPTGVSAPVERPAGHAPTTGTPEEKERPETTPYGEPQGSGHVRAS